jgi:hypothetical protein
MANTAKGYRYPATTDPVAQGATAIQNLATDVDTKAGVFASGQAAIPVTANNTNMTLTVTFPAGRFTAAPNVAIAPYGGNPSYYFTGVNNVTASGFTAVAFRTAGTGNINVGWIASQLP